MFKKTFRRKSASRSSSRAVVKTVERVLNRRERTAAEWHPMFTAVCQQLSFPPGDSCPNGDVSINIWNPQKQQTAGIGGQDTEGKLIQRITGDLYFRPVIPIGAPLTLQQRFDAYGELDVNMRVGLMKQRVELGPTGGFELIWNPLEESTSTGAATEGDWTQGRWVRQWEHMWGSQFKLHSNFFPFSCCSESVQTLNPLTNGTGLITIPASTCSYCGFGFEGRTFGATPNGVGPFVSFETAIPSWWHLHIDVKQKFRMENTDELNLWFGWEAVQPIGQTGRSVQPEMHVFGSLRGLYGS